MGRVLSAGNGECVRWLRREGGDRPIREYLTRTRGRLLSPRQLRLRQVLLDLPEPSVTSWLHRGRAPPLGSEGGLSRFHAEVLPDAQREALAAVGRCAARHGFYLAGGTAVATHLGHRQSVDLDWFTAAELAEPLGLAEGLRSELAPSAGRVSREIQV